VVAVVDGRSVDLMHALEADVVVDYTAHDYTKAARDLDAVFDAVG
jgi:NADPH:quinone reductase-like Zn-dependent oxidoreductase